MSTLNLDLKKHSMKLTWLVSSLSATYSMQKKATNALVNGRNKQ